MSIIINGKVYKSNVTIVNGRVINGDSCDDLTSKKFDETRKESANGINRITVDSDINVKVSACTSNNITAHLHGSAITNSTPKLSVTRFGDEIRVSVKLEGSSISCSNVSIKSGSSVVINTFNFSSSGNSGLTLDVQIPTRAFEKLSVESKNANIYVSAIFKTLNIDYKNGNIDVDSEAHSDIKLNVIGKNGNVDVTLENIGTSTVSVDSKNGSCRNNPRLRGIYTVSSYITSKNGNVKFR